MCVSTEQGMGHRHIVCLLTSNYQFRTPANTSTTITQLVIIYGKPTFFLKSLVLKNEGTLLDFVFSRVVQTK